MVLIALLVFGLVSLPGAVMGPWNLTALLGFASYALQVAAVVFLFRADAKAWLGGAPAADPITFD